MHTFGGRLYLTIILFRHDLDSRVVAGNRLNGPISAPAGKPSGTGPQPSARPIAIGTSFPITGVFAESIKPVSNAQELLEKQINARGGLLGRSVEPLNRDSKSDPDTAVAVYQKRIQDGVDFAFGTGGSILVQRVSTLAEQNKNVSLVPGGFARSLYERG